MLVQVGLGYAVLVWRWRRKPAPFPHDVPPASKDAMVSVIIPAYRERHTIGATLARLRDMAARTHLLEIVVVDAGGNDGTMDVVSASGVEVVVAESRGGRGPAVTAGVRASRGDIVLVVHGDTLLPRGFDETVRTALANPAALATAFKFRVNRDSIRGHSLAPFVVMEQTVRLRSTLLQLPFGDQALGLTRRRFESVGGLDDLATVPILEDYILVQRLRQLGATGKGRIVELPGDPAECDGRRWALRGVWRTNLTNQSVMLRYTYLSYTPAQIFALYYG
ncbi:hypothetical protein CTAYLR_009443 [Chrysophaeum taylorii]|uniref:Glycosyltransferase 2-like domain-containing protein n=1 Tax=Chrysophaeum taylorii TaxID=2483200 RepID=A0AAD7U806_9STRA|nr:hypothetical protein CTAYLR_009443 [Chrysophaeum taylorii]